MKRKSRFLPDFPAINFPAFSHLTKSSLYPTPCTVLIQRGASGIEERGRPEHSWQENKKENLVSPRFSCHQFSCLFSSCKIQFVSHAMHRLDPRSEEHTSELQS